MNTIQPLKTKEEAIEWIHSLKTLGIKPGLERMEWMLERLGHPEHRLRYIHVAGTNGKGSTVNYMYQVLRKSGYNVATFTSPYLIDFTNRIQVNQEDISADDLVEITNKLMPLYQELAETELGAPTEFEIVTMIAILYYATKAYPDIVLWETGLGGRLDSTNVIIPIVSVITNIGYDHMNLLGNNLKDIAKEKAGIIKPGAPVVTSVENEDAINVIQEVAKQKRCSIYQINEQYHVNVNNMDQTGSEFDFIGPFLTIPNVKLTMKGPHQVKNAAAAIMALEILRQYYAFMIDEDAVYNGLERAFWAGRFEVLADEPMVVVDGAHNPEGAKSLSDTISLFTPKRVIMVTGILQDKAIKEFYQAILQVADELIVTQPDFERAATVEAVEDAILQVDANRKITKIPDWQKAVDHALELASKDDLVVISGSLYMISDVRRYFKNKKS